MADLIFYKVQNGRTFCTVSVMFYTHDDEVNKIEENKCHADGFSW